MEERRRTDLPHGASMTAIPKDGHLYSPTFLSFVRNLPCCLCGSDPPSQAHHFPNKARGVTRDDKTLPVCAEDHRRCHGERLVVQRTDGGPIRLGPVSESRQKKLVEITRLKFLEHASAEQFRAFANDRAAWLESRGGAAPVPF